jgi:hypothetical protein
MTKQETKQLLQSNVLSREEVIRRLEASPNSLTIYNSLNNKLREEFLRFCEGKSSIWICYDVFFKEIFHPDKHPQRLERLLGAILGQKVKILSTMSNEGSPISDRGSIVIMDVVVRLSDGTIINLEIQKISYRFPAKRLDCYCSDLIMREYSRLREKEGKKFSYTHMPPVYSIVLFEQSPSELRSDTKHYIHFGRMKTDTGIELDSIIHYVYVTLDNFKKQMHNNPIKEELDAWLTLLSTQDLDVIEELVTNFEGFDEIYKEIFQLRTKPEELIQMYNNIFYEADRNEDRLLIEEMQDMIVERDNTISAQSDAIAERDNAIVERDNTISAQSDAIAERDARIAELEQQLASK